MMTSLYYRNKDVEHSPTDMHLLTSMLTPHQVPALQNTLHTKLMLFMPVLTAFQLSPIRAPLSKLKSMTSLSLVNTLITSNLSLHVHDRFWQCLSISRFTGSTASPQVVACPLQNEHF